MAKNKTKHIIPFIVFAVLFIATAVVCYSPGIDLGAGSLIKAIFDGLLLLLNRYAGFFKQGILSDFAVLPCVVLFWLLAFDFLINSKAYTIAAHCIFFASGYLFLGYLGIADALWITGLLPDWAGWAVLGLLALSGALSVFAIIREVVLLIKARVDRFSLSEKGKEKAFNKRVSKMDESQALATLTNLDLPEFLKFKKTDLEDDYFENSSVEGSFFQVASEASRVERENQLKREREESKEEWVEDRELEVEFESSDLLEIQTSDFEEKKTIVDEGTDMEDMDEVVIPKKNNVDLLSAVGGLKSAKNGDYLYDSTKISYKFPSEDLLKHYEVSAKIYSDMHNDPDGKTIVETLAQFKIDTQLVEIQHGPTFTLYELTLGKGIRVNTVLTLADNLAMNLAVQSVRILAPIPGKTAIGIEVPNKKRDTIGFDTMMGALKSKELKVPMVLGKTITGDSVIIDLAGAPHLLIAGTTGSGKSVCVNSLICSILYTKTPKQVRMILVDPKMVELTVYNDIPHLLTPVITDPKKAIKAMAFIVEEMERRMSMFSQLGARKIEDYNEKIVKKGFLRAPLPYIVVVIDEFADLMTVVGKELESYIKRITAVARFTGIHLVLATQRPSADVITGIIKSNMPTQIAFAVSNQVNSRIILDSAGAEKLLGRGDMLYASASNRTPQRIQGAYIDSEIEAIVKFVKTQGQPDYIDEEYFEDEEDNDSNNDAEYNEESGSEDMFTKAWKIVADRGEASASYLQRRLSIGYNRAANLIEQMEDAGYIGPARGSKPREILRYPDSGSEGFKD